MSIETKVGSATSPRPGKGKGVIIGHCCNSSGGWGRGFVLAVDELSAAPRAAYQGLAKDHGKTKDSPAKIPLGTVQFVEPQTGLFVSNMVAQDRYSSDHDDGCAVDYKALRRCLLVTFHRAIRLGYRVHIPEGIGSGLAGGNKDTILKLISECVDEVESTQWAKHNQTHLHITLWQFEDASAVSYVPPVDPAPVADLAPVATAEDATFTPDPTDDIANW